MSRVSFLNRLKQRWKLATSAVMAMFAVAVTYSFIVPTQWEASSIVQIGQVAQHTIGAQTQLAESASRLFERVKSKAFKEMVIEDLATPYSRTLTPDEVRIFTSSLNIKLLTNPDIVDIKVRGLTQSRAQENLEYVVKRLRTIHTELSAPTLAKSKDSLTILNAELESLNSERKAFSTFITQSVSSDRVDHFLQKSVYATLISNVDKERRIVLEKRLALEEQLSPARTYPTSVLDRIVVSKEPVAPLTGLALLMALVLSGFLVLLIVFGLPDEKNSQ
jgi:Chain length determinant protein